MKYYRVVVYLKEPAWGGESDIDHSLHELNNLLEVGYDQELYTIREFKETNEHKFNRAKDNEVKHV